MNDFLISTARKTGGLLWGYKPLLPAASQGAGLTQAVLPLTRSYP
jgi:hypothetical protein